MSLTLNRRTGSLCLDEMELTKDGWQQKGLRVLQNGSADGFRLSGDVSDVHRDSKWTCFTMLASFQRPTRRSKQAVCCHVLVVRRNNIKRKHTADGKLAEHSAVVQDRCNMESS